MKMKKYNILSVVLVLLISVFIVSCDTWIDPDINKDPNTPLVVPMEYLLPAIQSNMAYDLGGNDAVRTLGIWMQYFNGVDRQSETEGHFVYTPANCNNLWNSIYGVTGKDIYILISKANEKNADDIALSIHTSGVAKVLMADLLAFTTNLWNDIPYTEAFLGDIEGLMNPKLDTQAEIYATIDLLLSEAITELSVEESILPIEGDMIFDGDNEQWLATAYALRARYSLLLQKVNGASAYTEALQYADSALVHGFAGYIFDNYGTAANAKNPLAQFMSERSGDLVMGSTFIDMLVANNDPRLAQYSTGSEGSDPGTSDPGSLPGNYAAAATAPIVHMNLAELYFIMAESYIMTANSADAFDAYIDGVEASLDDVTGSHGTLPTDVDAMDEASLTLEDIMIQKYLANYVTVQAFNDWRRTGFPTLGMPFEAVTTEIPRRYPYPQEEETYNSNVSNVGIDLIDRVWWDVE
ncbi:MAG: hypothetical protein A2041_04205 [Bacteroidetes bacterium GWA2_31_9b]|nr:MAG: hypothetical protein A2041_04205 [Bacteroidetes bacterium GWA2_31_9b]